MAAIAASDLTLAARLLAFRVEIIDFACPLDTQYPATLKECRTRLEQPIDGRFLTVRRSFHITAGQNPLRGDIPTTTFGTTGSRQRG
jgi:hypothetical protein